MGLVTPVPGAVARPLIESLRNEATCGENDLAGLLGDDDRLGYDQAVELALSRVREAEVDTRGRRRRGPASAVEAQERPADRRQPRPSSRVHRAGPSRAGTRCAPPPERCSPTAVATGQTPSRLL